MSSIRPTKKQRELLQFIESFISQHGYSPSYREVMNGLHYNSVATVALHINNLIARGHLRKRDHSARSLEVVTSVVDGEAGAVVQPGVDSSAAAHESWLFSRMTSYLERRSDAADPAEMLADGESLARTLDLLGYPQQADSLRKQLADHVSSAG